MVGTEAAGDPVSDVTHAISIVAPWAGLSLLTLIFIANATGMLDQSVAVSELTATGVGERSARTMVGLGRLVQLVASPCLFFHATRPYAAMALVLFLIGATVAAHAFWNAAPRDRDRQLAGFLKNVAIIGGLLLAAGWNN